MHYSNIFTTTGQFSFLKSHRFTLYTCIIVRNKKNDDDDDDDDGNISLHLHETSDVSQCHHSV